MNAFEKSRWKPATYKSQCLGRDRPASFSSARLALTSECTGTQEPASSSLELNRSVTCTAGPSQRHRLMQTIRKGFDAYHHWAQVGQNDAKVVPRGLWWPRRKASWRESSCMGARPYSVCNAGMTPFPVPCKGCKATASVLMLSQDHAKSADETVEGMITWSHLTDLDVTRLLLMSQRCSCVNYRFVKLVAATEILRQVRPIQT